MKSSKKKKKNWLHVGKVKIQRQSWEWAELAYKIGPINSCEPKRLILLGPVRFVLIGSENLDPVKG